MTMPTTSGTGVVLAKLRSTERLLGAAGRTGVEPLRPEVPGISPRPIALDGTPAWFSVRTEPDASPWDQAPARLADHLGIDGGDVRFLAPDFVHPIFHVDEHVLVGGVGAQRDAVHVVDPAVQLQRAGLELPGHHVEADEVAERGQHALLDGAVEQGVLGQAEGLHRGHALGHAGQPLAHPH